MGGLSPELIAWSRGSVKDVLPLIVYVRSFRMLKKFLSLVCIATLSMAFIGCDAAPVAEPAGEVADTTLDAGAEVAPEATDAAAEAAPAN